MSLRVCVLASGSTGNATLVSDGQTHILVDCGLVAKEIEGRLGVLGIDPSDLAGILITHAHMDHFRSAGTIHARYGVPVHIDVSADKSIRQRASNGSYHRLKQIKPIDSEIGGITIENFTTSHEVWGGHPVAFVLSKGDARVGIVTDTGKVSRQGLDMLRGCQIMVVEANYDADTLTAKLNDRRYSMDWQYLRWVESDRGHLSNGQCAKVLAETVTAETEHVFLAHISDNHVEQHKDNNSYAQARKTVRDFFRREGLQLPTLHQTWRRGATEGRASTMVTVD